MKNKRGILWIITGLLLIAAALAIIGYNLWEDKQAEKSVRDAMEQLKNAIPVQTQDTTDPNSDTEDAAETVPAALPAEEEIPDYILNPNMEMPEQTINGYDYIGIIKITACDIELPVISEWNYPALKVAPCRFEGSVYTDDMIIAAHAYKAHFRRIRDLSGGEKVLFTDTAGNEFSYEVVSVETISGTDVDGLIAGEWDLSLFTCTVDGTARVVVRCERLDNE